ncbi:MAG: DNA helicase RecQ [Candidatus Omnitrophica bacterium]|nr:DNA helicase RecQ [Candidatus Omnitrophota bacterium]
MNNNKLNILKSVFGYKTFRPLQEACIDAVLNKQDTMLIMPTGGGKSICYQIPALMMEGLTVVVSPLISLMKDQVSQLKALGVEAELLNSSLTFEEYLSNKARIISGKTKLLFCAPETLFKEDILEMLSSLRVDCLTIDEAHCISEWGHDFRPEYRRIKDVRQLFPHAVYLAVTATATRQVRQDIMTNLNLQSPVELLASFNRDNLFYEVIPKNRATDQTVEFLNKFKGQSGIIYCFSRKQVDELTKDLNYFGFKALPYHAGLDDQTRQTNQELFIRDDVPIMVATIAFGMGINKPNVRFVVHYDLPKNIESYYQETGRAGRDGLPSHCLLLFSAGDGAKIRYFIEQKTDPDQKRVAANHLNTIIAYAQTRQCRRIPLISYFGENYKIQNCGLCDNCVNPVVAPVDLTVEAVKFLQCVSETEERFGASHVINVLRGSQSEKVLNYNHQDCRTFGAGKALSIKEWQYLVQQFIVEGLLEKDEEYGVLSFNKNSYELLSNKRPFKGHRLPAETILSKPSASRDVSTEHYDKELFEKLRAKRKQLADQRGVPPYVIFSDKSLIDMCQRRPKTKAQFSQVFGVGEQKLEKFGDMFLRLINSV